MDLEKRIEKIKYGLQARNKDFARNMLKHIIDDNSVGRYIH